MKIFVIIKKGIKKMKDKIEKRCELISNKIDESFPNLDKGTITRRGLQYFFGSIFGAIVHLSIENFIKGRTK